MFDIQNFLTRAHEALARGATPGYHTTMRKVAAYLKDKGRLSWWPDLYQGHLNSPQALRNHLGIQLSREATSAEERADSLNYWILLYTAVHLGMEANEEELSFPWRVCSCTNSSRPCMCCTPCSKCGRGVARVPENMGFFLKALIFVAINGLRGN